MAPFRGDYGEGFYLAALRYAQSLWLQGKPAQAILQLNKAWSASLRGDEAVLKEHPSPFRALAWILRHVRDGDFLGNPVRHFQHLATRMSGRNAEVRTWRAWACFALSERLLDPGTFPRDEVQIRKEHLKIPDEDVILIQLNRLGWPGEGKEGQAALRLVCKNERV